MNPIEEYNHERKRFEALCTIRNQLPETVKSSRKLEAMATKYVYIGTRGMHTDYATLTHVLGLSRPMIYHYIKNINSGQFSREIEKYKNVSFKR